MKKRRKKINRNEIQTDYCNSLFISNVRKSEKCSSRQRLSIFFWMNVSYQNQHDTNYTTHITHVDWNIFIYSADYSPWRKRTLFFALENFGGKARNNNNNNSVRTDSIITDRTHNTLCVRERGWLSRPAYTINHRCHGIATVAAPQTGLMQNHENK